MSTDYYLVSHEHRRALCVTDDHGNPMNRGCWERFLLEVIAQSDGSEPVVFVPDWELPEGYEQCDGQWGGSECSCRRSSLRNGREGR